MAKVGCFQPSVGLRKAGWSSPLLANLYMNRFLKYWRQSGKERQ